MPPALGAPTQPKYIPSSNLITPSSYLEQLVYTAAGETPPSAAPAPAPDNYIPGSTYIPPEQATAAAPVPSEMYGGPAPAVSEPYSDPNTIVTSYPAANAASGGDPYFSPTVDTVVQPQWDQPVGPASDPYGAYSSAQTLPALARTVAPLDDPSMLRTAWRRDTQPIVTQLPGTGDARGVVPSERFGGPAPVDPYAPRTDTVEVYRRNAPVEARKTGYQAGRAQTPMGQEPTADPYLNYRPEASDIRTLPAQQPSLWESEQAFIDAARVKDRENRTRVEAGVEPYIPGTALDMGLDWLKNEGAQAAANILPGIATFLTPGMDPVFGNRVREAQDAIGQVESSEAGRLSKEAHQNTVDPFVEKGLGSILGGFKRSASLAQGQGVGTQPNPVQPDGVRDAAWTSGTRDWLETRGTGASSQGGGAVDPYATGGTSATRTVRSSPTTTPVVNDGDVSRNRAAKLLTPDLQFITSERTSDAFGGGTGSYSLRVIHGEPGAPVATDAIVTPQSMVAAQEAGMAAWMLNDDEFAMLVDAGLVTEDARGQVVGKPLLIPAEWAGVVGATGDALSDVQAVDPYTAPATDTNSSSSGGGSGWVDYGNGGGYTRRSYSRGGGGGGYSSGGGGYSSGGGYSGGGDWGGGFDMGALPEGFGGEDGFMSGAFDSPIFARYFDVLSRHMGEDGATSLMQRMRGMKRGLRRSKRSRTRSMTGGRTLTTKGPRPSSINEGLNVPSNDRVREDVGKQVKKATKGKDA